MKEQDNPFVRKYILKAMRTMQRRHCAYDMMSAGINAPAPPMCDCKFGYASELIKPFGESTGCAELRVVVKLLSLMTDSEYKIIMAKKRQIK